MNTKKDSSSWVNYKHDFSYLSVIGIKNKDNRLVKFDDIRNIKLINELPFKSLNELLSECDFNKSQLYQEIHFWEKIYSFNTQRNKNFKRYKKRYENLLYLKFEFDYVMFHIESRFQELSNSRGLCTASDYKKMSLNEIIYERTKLNNDDFASKFIGDNEWEEWFIETRLLADTAYKKSIKQNKNLIRSKIFKIQERTS